MPSRSGITSGAQDLGRCDRSRGGGAASERPRRSAAKTSSRRKKEEKRRTSQARRRSFRHRVETSELDAKIRKPNPRSPKEGRNANSENMPTRINSDFGLCRLSQQRRLASPNISDII